ncbi:hypothetical protein [Rhodococcus sp. NPDC058521]|uniref:hypothetical protein n=1 Tax=Rhodococcus sp. NPDC058521 TaxID=3346536 RepID=UPI003651A598
MHSALLGFHVTVALGLSIMLGVQCVELGRIVPADADEPPRITRASTLVIKLVPMITAVVAVTGGILVGTGSEGGPWIGAGVIAAVVIAGLAFWTLRQLRDPYVIRGRTLSGVRAVQWGAPSFVLAGTFLMAVRPRDVPTAVIPIVLAVAVAVGAYFASEKARQQIVRPPARSSNPGS